MKNTPALVCAFALVATSAVAQVPKKDETVVLKVPVSALAEKSGWTFWHVGEVTRGTGGVLINGSDAWRSKPLASLVEGKITKVKVSDQKTEVELKTQSPYGYGTQNVRFVFRPSDFPSLLDEVVIRGGVTSEQVQDFKRNIRQSAAASMFRDFLASIPAEQQMKIFDVLQPEPTAILGVGIEPVTYKDKHYLSVNLGESDSVYNTLKLDQGQRVSKVFNEHLLDILKTTAKAVNGASIDGISVRYGIPFKSFAAEYATPEVDQLQVFVPLDLLKQFMDADITSQQLLDGSVVLVNGNRVEVRLS